jgi:hypothetical protein
MFDEASSCMTTETASAFAEPVVMPVGVKVALPAVPTVVTKVTPSSGVVTSTLRKAATLAL